MPLVNSSKLHASNGGNKAFSPHHGHGDANVDISDQPHQEPASIPSCIEPELHDQTLNTISFQNYLEIINKGKIWHAKFQCLQREQ